MEIAKQMMSRALLAAAAAITVAVAIITVLPAAPASAQNDDETAGRIVARLLNDGRVEFGWQPAGGERVLPRQRYFPADARVDRWLRSGPIVVGGAAIGRINARLLDNGRIEFAFTPTDGERITPRSRYFPTDARVSRWLRSTEIAIDPDPTDHTAPSANPARFTALSAGGSHTCAIRESGAIECWGDDRAGKSSPPDGSFTAVSAGDGHSCGLRETGAVECWGWNWAGQTDAPAGRFSAVNVGWDYTCGLRETGEIECWGNNTSGQADALAGRFSAISAGYSRTCGLRETGAVECWRFGRYASGRTDAPAGRFSAVSVGLGHSCGLRETGAVECWGDNEEGQADAPAGQFSAVSAGWFYTCGVRENGRIACWGSNNEYGRADAPEGSFTAVSAGINHTCAIRDTSELECWGHPSYARYIEQMYDAPIVALPAQLPTVSVVAGDDGVTEAQISELQRWMDHIAQEFAMRWGERATANTSVRVFSGDDAYEMATGNDYTCGIAGGSTMSVNLRCLNGKRIAGVLAHEYLHVIQHRLSTTAGVPVWLVEGSAEWAPVIYESLNNGRSYTQLQGGFGLMRGSGGKGTHLKNPGRLSTGLGARAPGELPPQPTLWGS